MHATIRLFRAMSKKLADQIKTILRNRRHAQRTASAYLRRLRHGRLTRDEHPASHFCVYFAAFDPAKQEVFIGHHKKSGLWLFSGGHIDRGEMIEEAVSREIWEEWGQRIPVVDIPQPSLLTITNVLTPNIGCKIHFDIWHFFPVEKEKFEVDQSKILEEFREIGWFPIDDILLRIADPATRKALKALETLL